MIKCETIGQLEVAKINPVLTSASDVENYTFITDNDILYLVANTLTGDATYTEDAVIKAGEYLNGYQVDAWVGQKLVVDGKHVAYASGKDIDDIAVDDILTVDANGKLAVAQSAPESGVYFTVTDIGVKLTEKGFKAVVCVA